MKTNLWINPIYLEEKKLNEIKKEFKENKPFCHLSLNNFLIKEKAEFILEELNKLNYYLEDHDLYQFERTTHFKHIKNKKIQEILNQIFSEEFIKFIENLTSTKLSRIEKELHSLKLTNTHYLLCHDDKVQDRKIAFIINLSKNWTNKDGGTLDLFNSKNREPTEISKQIIPEFNQFNIFEVNNTSFHQISEILTNKNRISLAGWFYKNEK